MNAAVLRSKKLGSRHCISDRRGGRGDIGRAAIAGPCRSPMLTGIRGAVDAVLRAAIPDIRLAGSHRAAGEGVRKWQTGVDFAAAEAGIRRIIHEKTFARRFHDGDHPARPGSQRESLLLFHCDHLCGGITIVKVLMILRPDKRAALTVQLRFKGIQEPPGGTLDASAPDRAHGPR